MDPQPTLSVLIPNYNHARFLPEAIGRLLEQSYRPSEIIVVDDCSTDNSVAVLEEMARREPIIRLIRNERNMGVVYNLNRLLEAAQGDYLYFAAADDWVLPGFLEKSMTLLRQYPQAGLCSTLSRSINGQGEDEGLIVSPVVSSKPAFLPPRAVRRTLCAIGYWFSGNTVVYRREALAEAGGFIPELQCFVDSFACHLIALKHGACFIPEPLAAWRRMETGYAATCLSAPDFQRDLVNRATGLMRTRYQRLFPPQYANLWRRDIVYGFARNASMRHQALQESLLNQWWQAQRDRHHSASLLYRLRLIFLRAQAAATVARLLLRHLPPQVVRRRLHRLVHPYPSRNHSWQG